MTAYFPGPGLLELQYTVSGLSHAFTMNVEPTSTPAIGTSFDNIDLRARGGGTRTLEAWADLISAAIDGLFDIAVSSFDIWNFYLVAPFSYDRTFISQMTPSDQPNSGTGYVPSSQSIFNFRTEGGNIAKLVLLEQNYGQNDCVGYADLVGVESDIVDVLDLATTSMIGRDGEFVFQFMRRCAGQNEKTWRRRNRN